ncbi:MAG: single-stranded-DNA-specific exonuclease RecJ [Pseudomonadales bacterium]|nr:single-stranded-DNA-specific exonuclease RecJ [Pseudomonadales bacterium]
MVERPCPEGVDRLAREADIPPLLARLYAARGIRSASELDLSLGALPDPGGLPGMDEAVALLRRARQAGTRICIVGDYDADGATSTAVLVKGLTLLGFPTPDHLVPDRFTLGYGLTAELVDLAVRRHPRPELIVTVDNGIAAHEGVLAARRQGMEVLVTDHHLPGPTLPEAAAILNPRIAASPTPFDALAGVGVAFFLLAALRRALRDAGELPPDGGAALVELLDLVALGTVADVVPLDPVNRALVRQGIARMRAGRARPGIAALAAVAGRALERLVAADLGFALAPRLNAAGRLEDMSEGIACLLAEDDASARGLAERLDALNAERREIEADMRAEALAAAERLALDGALPPGLCLFDPGWHAGVVGIVAARVKDRVHRPVVAFAPDGQGALRGSARSIRGLHVRDAIAAVASRHPALVTRFGGHAMAAGLTLPAAHFETFAAAFGEEVGRHLDASALGAEFVTDGELASAELDLATALLIERAGPWGQGFPEPEFHGCFEVISSRVVGEAHLRLELRAGARRLPAIAFGAVEAGWSTPPSPVRIVYRPVVDRYRGDARLQLQVRHLEAG